MNKGLIFLSILINSIYAAAQDSSFACPIKKGKIVIEETQFTEVMRRLGAVIEGKDGRVFSVSAGTVSAVDTADGLLRVYVSSNEYFFSYNVFSEVNVTAGQHVQKGQLLGRLKKNDRLFLICRKNGDLIDPKRILKCKAVTRYLD